MKSPVMINEFAEAVSKRIRYHVVPDQEPWYGEDLMLGGFKNLKPDGIYSVRVPIEDKDMQTGDYKDKIIKCYNRGRKPAVERYLAKYFEKQTLNHLMQLL